MLFFYLKKFLSKIKNHTGTIFFILILGILAWSLDSFLTVFRNMGESLRRSNFIFVFLSMIIHLINHFIRAFRWKFLLRNKKYNPSLWRLFEAEMVGFCSNIFVPRSGEIVRCRLLRNFSGVPFRLGLSSVIAERSIDILFFFLQVLLLILLLLFSQREGLFLYQDFSPLDALFSSNNRFVSFFYKIGGGGVALLFLFIGGLLFLFSYRTAYPKLLVTFFNSIKKFLLDTAGHIKRAFSKEKLNILLTSLAVWGSYFVVEYLCLKALNSTSGLSLMAIFMLFISINIGISIPLPGNIGGYHVLVAGVLISLGIPKEEAFTYATLTHGIQFFNAFIVGGMLSLQVQWQMRRKKKLVNPAVHKSS